jgi:hypothetical protein
MLTDSSLLLGLQVSRAGFHRLVASHAAGSDDYGLLDDAAVGRDLDSRLRQRTGYDASTNANRAGFETGV